MLRRPDCQLPHGRADDIIHANTFTIDDSDMAMVIKWCPALRIGARENDDARDAEGRRQMRYPRVIANQQPCIA